MPGHYKVEVIGESKARSARPGQLHLALCSPIGIHPQVTGETRATPQVQAQTAPQTIADRESEASEAAQPRSDEAGLPALVPDERLSHIARMHSDEMAKRHAVFHHSPTTGTPEDAGVRRAKIKNAILAENLAQARRKKSRAEPYRGQSRGTAATSPIASSHGWALAWQRKPRAARGLQLYVTQLFYRD